LPVPQRPQELGWPVQDAPSSLPPFPPLEAKTESFLVNFTDPQCGHGVPFHSLERTRISLSRSQLSQ
jgi:hypothetical protein